MNYFDDDIESVEASDVSEIYMCEYGININLQRSIPMINDGVKLVVRRILYMMYLKYRNVGVKGTSLIGDALKIHPHGDLGMGGIISRMCQEFSNNIPLLNAPSNTGNATTGDDYASPRYIINITLSDFAKDVLFDEFDGKVNMRESSDIAIKEPIALPSKFPIILLNGTSGIGWTLSTDVPPYNLNEIADATIKLLKNPQAKVNLVPDLPTGCDIIVKDPNTFIMQSSFEIDPVNYVITIKNTPYLKYLDDIDKALRAIQDSENKIKEIDDACDESDLEAGKVEYVIRCRPCNLYQLVNTLFRRVPGFRSTISTRNMLVVTPNFRTDHYDVRQILCSWIGHRLREKRNWFLRQLVALGTEYNMNEVKAFLLSPKNLDKTVKVYRSCDEKKDIGPALMKAYPGKVSSSQGEYMSGIEMYRVTKKEYERTIERMEQLEKEIKRIKGIVKEPEKIKEAIIDEIKEIKQKYGYPRRSKILNLESDTDVNIGVVQILPDGTILFSETENPEHLSSDITPLAGDNVCLIDDKGYFLWVDTNKVLHDKPMTLTSIGKQQMGKCVAALSNPDNSVVLLSNRGRIKFMPITSIPTNATKKPLVPLDDDEYIVSVIEVRDASQDILVYTSDGMGKRVQISDLNLVKSVDAQGQFIVRNDAEVAGMFTINPNKQWLVYVTRLGRIRVNHAKFLNPAKKFGDLKPIIKLSQQDDLIAVFCTNKEQKITLNHVDSRTTSVNIDSIEPTTMATPPVRPKHVPGVKVLRATIS
jgi:DNA gyrase/topoisomerase IV subunit A